MAIATIQKACHDIIKSRVRTQDGEQGGEGGILLDAALLEQVFVQRRDVDRVARIAIERELDGELVE